MDKTKLICADIILGLVLLGWFTIGFVLKDSLGWALFMFLITFLLSLLFDTLMIQYYKELAREMEKETANKSRVRLCY